VWRPGGADVRFVAEKRRPESRLLCCCAKHTPELIFNMLIVNAITLLQAIPGI
jgi:hypothetical protein